VTEWLPVNWTLGDGPSTPGRRGHHVNALLSPTNPVGFAWMMLRGRADDAQEQDDLGASAIEWIIITAIVVAMAVAIGVFIWQRIQNSETSINNQQTPTGP
jgi:hypothetical protein